MSVRYQPADASNGTDRDPGTKVSRVGLWAGLLVAALVLLIPAPPGMETAAWRVAAVGSLMAIWWVTEAIPLAATALIPLVAFPLLGIGSVREAAAPYANPVIFLFLGGFLIGAALEACGLHRRLALGIVRRVGTRPTRLVGGFMLATAFLSMWVSNTATVVMMVPTALSIVALVESEGGGGDGASHPRFATALMLGIAYAGNLGGLGTLIGTPPNALLAGYLEQVHGVTLGFAEWMLVGVPLVAVALPLCWWLLTRVICPIRLRQLPGGRTAIQQELQALGRPSRAEISVGVIVALTAAAWVLRPLLARWIDGLSDAGIAIAAAVVLFLVPVDRRGRRALTWAGAERLPWAVLLLFGGGLSLAAAVQLSGLAEWIGGALSGLARWPLALVIVVVVAVVIFLTELTSNTATAATFLPVVGALAVVVGMPPQTLAVGAALAASCAFMLPVATPPNAIVYGSGRVTIGQMLRAGLVLNLLLLVLISGIVLLWVGPALG